MSDPKTELLKKVPLFTHCTRTSLESVTSNTDEVDVEQGRTLIHQGQPSDTFYVLLDGEAEVLIAGQRRRTLGPGDFFGEISMLDRGPATATITTTKPSRMMVMSHLQFRDAIKGNQELLLQVLQAVAERLRADATAGIQSR
ncbi:MAG TPA: cyclic nucleotide-binding domain-containing protein [Candidatus Dormibacteraeota bacterium]|nr:cyclic nucleotide-binding domain-containing protein [Candidatus Dormibacteraeota bacterium]